MSIFDSVRLPRKFKKKIFGRKLNKSKLAQLLKTVQLGEPIRTMYERRTIKPYPFCPKCGCLVYIGSGNLTSYPEHWEKFRCIRCHTIVGYIDNSPFIHALECVYNEYDRTTTAYTKVIKFNK